MIRSLTHDGGNRRSTDDGDSLLRAIAATSERAPDATLTRLAHFRILGLLGKGGMGVVYRAEDETLRRTVALKVLADTSGDVEKSQRFLREARSAGSITHPNVAVIHQIGEAEGRVYIAMELVEGENLRTRLERGRLDLPAARELAAQIARGLSAAHDKGIVHRDLKPENVMITPSGVVKLLDFGLAKSGVDRPVSGKTEAALAKTETLVTSDEGRIMGTPEYMSPEQAMGEPVDVRSDVFSFGTMFYEMLSGTRPFTGASTGHVLVAITRDAAPPLRERAPHVDEATEAVVMRCLAKAPGARFGNAGEVVTALVGQTSPKATTESRTDVPPLTRGEAKPARTGTSRLAAAALLAIGVVAAGSWWVTRPRASAPASVPVVAAPTATAMTDHPPPKTNNAEAAAEYAGAMQAFRDAAMAIANRKLVHATKLDPNFAAAQLRLVLYEGLSRDDARRRFAAASQNRASLSECDRDLLAVAEPLALPEAPDHAESARRARAAAARWPDDAEAALVAGMRIGFAGDLEAAFVELDRALSLDEHNAGVLNELATFQGMNGDGDGVLASGERCLSQSQSAAACARRRAEVFAVRGQCDAMEREARRAVAGEPDGLAAQGYLVEALVARRAPVGAIRDALQTQLRFADESDRPVMAETMERELAEYTGDLEAMLAHELEANRLARRIDPTSLDSALILYSEEIGKRPQAVALAEELLRHIQGGIGVDVDAEDLSMALSELRLAGRADDGPEFVRRREGWIVQEAIASSTSPWNGAPAADAWIDLYARPAATRDQAREAIAALPRFPPLPRVIGNPGVRTGREEPIGRVYLLAGEIDDAITHLRLAASSCGVMSNLPIYLHAHEELGEALAAKGDTAGACAEYGVVLSYWGHAKPRSITADKARAGRKALGCTP